MVFYNLAVIAVNGNQHKTTFTTVQSNSAYIAWCLNLTARQFIVETTCLGQTDVPLGVTVMPARRFSG